MFNRIKQDWNEILLLDTDYSLDSLKRKQKKYAILNRQNTMTTEKTNYFQ